MADRIHWADIIAENMLIKGGRQRIVINFIPLGLNHINDIRAAVIADAIYKTLLSRNVDADLILIADNYEPLLKVFPFLPESYAEYLGKPIFEIPCPCRNCTNYAEHFIGLFLETLKSMDINPEIFRANEIYSGRKSAQFIKTALVQKERIAGIPGEIAGKPATKDWSPFTARCNKCGRITTTRVTGINLEAESVYYVCNCGDLGTVPMAGGGKLTLPVAWPFFWEVFRPTVEVTGKGDALKNRAYDLGKRVIREIYGDEPPYPVLYESGSFGKQGTVSSWKESFSVSEILAIMPPEILRYLILRTKPEKPVKFDPGQPFLALVNEYENLKAKFRENDPSLGVFEKRIYELSEIKDLYKPDISFKQMVMICQAARGDLKQILETLKRSGLSIENEKYIRGLITNASNWLESYAPPFMKFSVKEKVPIKAATLSKVQKAFLKAFAATIDAKNEINAEEYHLLIYSAAKKGSFLNMQIEKESGIQLLNINPEDLFKAIYISILGQNSGPKAGWFLSSFEKDFLVKRFKEASSYIPGTQNKIDT
ncbi:MAG: lysine--tRNA ligase [Methanosarcina sp.]